MVKRCSNFYAKEMSLDAERQRLRCAWDLRVSDKARRPFNVLCHDARGWLFQIAFYKYNLTYEDRRPNRSVIVVFVFVYGLVWFNPLLCFFGSKGHVALDRNPGPGYDTLLLRMIPGDLLSAFPHRQFNTLPGLLDSWAALPNSTEATTTDWSHFRRLHCYSPWVHAI